MAARSDEWVCGRTLVGIAGSNPDGAWISASFVSVWCLVNRGLCVGPIPRPEEFYRMCVCVFN